MSAAVAGGVENFVPPSWDEHLTEFVAALNAAPEPVIDTDRSRTNRMFLRAV